MISSVSSSTEGVRHEGTRLPGGYEIRAVRRGGMGVVYLVYSPEAEMPFAVKTIQRQFLMSYEAQERFKREVRSWLRLGDHPHIVQALFVEVIDNLPHLFMEYVDGQSLLEHIGGSPLRLETALDYAIQICRGMHYAHSVHHLIHRDLKPSNIMVSADGCVKITDFGLVKALDANDELNRTSEGNTPSHRFSPCVTHGSMGTPEYMAPEQWASYGALDGRTDIYAFGVVLYEMLCGHPPFERESGEPPYVLHARHLKSLPPDPADRGLFIPEQLKAIVLRCLEKSPRQRFQGFNEVAELLCLVHQQVLGCAWALRGSYRHVYAKTNETTQKVNRAASLHYIGDHAEALSMLNEVLGREPENRFALRLRAQCACTVSRFQDALADLERLAGLAPDDTGVHNDMSFVLNELGRHQDAHDCADRAINLSPGDASAWNNRGVAAAGLSRFDEARESFEAALGINPQYPEVWNNLGHLHRLLNHTSEAEACFQRAIALNPRYLKPYFNLNQIMLEREDIDGSVALLESVLAVEPGHHFALKAHAALVALQKGDR
ncbi:MAG: protein kinase [Lentisphaerae bacterium]|nr:protein kinase [Lentisphaerota bacterium]OQC11766.1 MAG: Serine/threonine-protein kinase PrkC [Lentisphaerae bacterium ADurb.Bin082]HQL86586.1 protein kinase [Lentisphaeria bacterium]